MSTSKTEDLQISPAEKNLRPTTGDRAFGVTLSKENDFRSPSQILEDARIARGEISIDDLDLTK